MIRQEQISEVDLLSNAKKKLLEKYLRGQMTQSPATIPSITLRPAGEPVPLSYSQEQVWIHSQVAGDIPIYNEAITVRRRGPLDVNVLERCLLEIIRRHEAWRTTFDVINGKPIQVIRPAPDSFPVPIFEIQLLEEHKREEEALRLATIEARKPFDLKKGPLLRAILVSLTDDDHRLHITFHQIIFDAVSAYRVFLPELAALYKAFSAGQPSPLAELSVQYGDYAYWQRNLLPQKDWSTHLKHWQQTFKGEIRILQWPNDRQRLSVQSHRGATRKFRLAPELVRSLRQFARKEGASLYMVLVAAYAAVLHFYTGQEEIVLGGLSAGRKSQQLEQLAGYFVNPFAFRINFSGDPGFRELLRRVREQILNGLDHDDMPFDLVVRGLRVPRDPSRNPLFQIVLSLQPQTPVVDSGWNLATEEVSNGGSKVDLMIVIDDRGDSVFGPITFNPDLFDPTTISNMIEHWETMLEHAMNKPDQRLSESVILSEAERRRILVEWNDTRREYPAVCAHELLAAQADRTPGNVAAVFEHQQLSYRELDERANQLAELLRQRGVGPDVLVGICMDRSLEMLIAMLAVWKAGGAYVPLDSEYPIERLSFIVEDSGLKILLTQEKYRARFSKFNVEVVCPLFGVDENNRDRAGVLGIRATPTNLAYVIYTSGSTGKPKGVQIEHRSVVNFLTSMQERPGLGPSDVLLAVTTISFDIAGMELFLPLSVGARVVLASRDISRDGERLQEILAKSHATCMQATPATWRMLINSGWSGDSNLKVLCGGEALTAELARKLLERSSEMWNLYGPTETTIWSAAHRVTSVQDPTPIGRPIANTEFYVLNRHLQPVPAGVVGDIFIGGDGLARGYLKRPDLTAEKFIPCPFDEGGSRGRIYETGDIGRYRSDGTLELWGRRDDQLKVRGYRIEPNEIATTLNQHNNIRASIVVARDDGAGEKQLVAYVVPQGEADLCDADLREHLLSHLPQYMVPAAFVLLESLPLNPNGKIDRSALPAPDQGNRLRKEIYAVPTSSTEKRVGETLKAILQVDQVGANDNFFLMGGHSLAGTQLIARLRDSFGVDVTLRDLFDAPTIAGISRAIERLLLSRP